MAMRTSRRSSRRREDNCRQIFARAKQRIAGGKPRFENSREKRDELARRFLAACEGGDLAGLEQLLAADATFYGDGGGKVPVAVRQPVHGRDRVARLLHGIIFKRTHLGMPLAAGDVNGQPGAMMLDSAGSFDLRVRVWISPTMRFRPIRSVINPDKLQHLGPLSDWARLPPNQESQ